MAEILEYSGTISTVCRWVQEFLGNQLTVIHSSSSITMDVDSLAWRFGSLIGTYCVIAWIMYKRDTENRSSTYIQSVFYDDNFTELQNVSTHHLGKLVLSSSLISYSTTSINNAATHQVTFIITSSQILYNTFCISTATPLKFFRCWFSYIFYSQVIIFWLVVHWWCYWFSTVVVSTPFPSFILLKL